MMPGVLTPNWFFNIPLQSNVTMAVLAGITLVLVVATVVFWKRRRVGRWVILGSGLMMLMITVAVVVLNHFGYYPVVGNVFGLVAEDARGGGLEAARAAARKGESPPSGWVFESRIPGSASGFNARPAYVYLPPAWFDSPRPELPVLLLLHGTPGEPSAWTRSNEADTTTDAFAARHDGRAPILVMPAINSEFDSDSECVDGTDGNVETYLTVDVRDWVLANLDPATDAQQWGLGGYSEGGFCALMLTLKHPELWHTLLDFGGEAEPTLGNDPLVLFKGSRAEQCRLWNAHKPRNLVRDKTLDFLGGWFSGGTEADIAPRVVEMARVMCENDLETVLSMIPNQGHTFWSWKQAYVDALPWAAARMGIGRFDPTAIPPNGQFIQSPPAPESSCGLLKM